MQNDPRCGQECVPLMIAPPLLVSGCLKLPFVCVQALHALCLTDVALCMPPQDAVKYVRCLAPYLKVAPLTSGPRSPDKDRRDAERLLCKLVCSLHQVLRALICYAEPLSEGQVLC